MIFLRSLGTFLICVVLLQCVEMQGIAAADPIFSGPQVGESLPDFELIGVYDDLAGKSISPLKQAGDAPVVIVFVHKLTRPGFALTRAITRYTASLKQKQSSNDTKVYVAWLADDQAEAEAFLNRARKSLNLNVPVGISPDGGEGPGAYGLNRNVELTILVANEKKVTANHALVQPSLVDGKVIAAEIAEVSGTKAPTIEQLESLAFPGRAKMMRQKRTDRTSAKSRER